MPYCGFWTKTASYSGVVVQTIQSPVDEIVFFHANQPIIYSHAALFRIIPTGEGR